MKRTLAAVSALLILFSLSFVGCTGGKNKPENKTEETTTTFNERASYYDELAKGDIAVEVETTADDNTYFEFSGDINLFPEGIYKTIRNIVNNRYTSMYSKYGKNYRCPKITLVIDISYVADTPCHANGKTVYINPNWFADHPDDCDSILSALFQSMQDYSGTYPEWLESSLSAYARYEFATQYASKTWEIPQSYAGKSYEEGDVYGASFLRWIELEFDNAFISRLNKALINGSYEESFWQAETGLTFGQLWAKYKET